MRWNRGESSEDVEDRRGGSGGGGGFRGGGMRLGLGGVLVLLVLSVVFKRNFFALLDTGPSASLDTPPAGPPAAETAESKELVEFVKFVLNDTQATWTRLFPEMGGRYERAKLVLFTDETVSGCGAAQAATGPFYCPADRKVYVDLGFYGQLRSRFGAPGDFAQAYVIAHEIGHHVQHLLGIEEKVRRQQEARPDLANALSVRMELQADCLAGVWGHSTEQRGILEKGDVEEGLGAAAAIGDDRLQRMSTGRVSPESFTHGSSRQRVDWFKRGLASGSPNACDTFGAREI